MQPTLVKPAAVRPEQVHPRIAAYMQGGAEVGTAMRDVKGALTQIPRIGWALLFVGSAYVSYKSYRRYKREKGRG